MKNLFYKIFIITMLALVISKSASSQNTNVPLPKALKGIVWKIDQLYIDTNRVYDGKVDSLRFQFIDSGMVVLSAGAASLSRPYDYNPGKKQITINYQDVPDIIYDVLAMTPNILILQTQTNLKTGGQAMLEYRLVPE
jgi:hypothetical protein